MTRKEKLYLLHSLITELLQDEDKKLKWENPNLSMGHPAADPVEIPLPIGTAQQLALPYTEKDILSQGEAARFLGIGTSTLALLCKKKKIGYSQPTGPKGYRKFKVSDLQAYLTKHRMQAK